MAEEPQVNEAEQQLPKKRPWRCPVCVGRGFVLGCFYGDSTAGNTTPCRSCMGSGVIWG